MGCASCGAHLAAAAKFCSECGTPVAGAASPRTHPLTERRITSVLFGDLVGFTTLSENRDSEDVRELLSQYFETSRQIIERYGGIVEKFIGDAVMAVWGVPSAHEDDAERAVRAGLDLVQAVAAFGASAGAPGLSLRAGVVTGEVAVTVGARYQGMVAGDAVNTAARVQTRAEPGTVWVDAQTRSLAGASIDFADAGTHELKGKAEPLPLFVAVSVRGGRGGGRSADRVQAPLVARTRELGIVKEMFHVAVEDARPRLVLLTGEAGIGKSRLTWELRSYLDGVTAPVLWHAARCPSYGDGLAFSALTAAVRSRIGADPDDGDELTRQRLGEALEHWVPDVDERGWIGAALETLLGLPGERTTAAQDELFRAWITWFERLHEREDHPVVWVVDDAHLADEGLLDFVERLVMVARAPVLVVLTARPELLAQRPWLASLRRASPVPLAPLAADESAALLRGLVEGAPDDVLDELVTRVEGNPLYAIETVRALHDQGLAVSGPTRTPGAVRLADGVDRARLRALAAPASLQILVASRLDLLGPADRAVLAAASVLHPSVTASALQALVDHPEVVPDALDVLVDRDLLTPLPQTGPGVQRYAFVQTVVRQVAYGTQSRRDRLARHLAAAEHFEPFADTDRDLSGVIAQHLRDALSLTSAHRVAASAALRVRLHEWLERTARRAEAVGAPMEAVRVYLELLELTDDPAETVRLQLAAAGAAAAAGDHAAALELAVPVATGAAPSPADAAFATAIASIACRRRGDYARAWTYLERYAATGATDALPVLAASRLTREIGAYYAETGRLEQAWEWQERSVNLAEDTADPREIVRSTNNFAITAGNRGHARIAIALFRLCVDVAREHHLVAEYALPLDNLIAYVMNRDLAEALTAGAESLRVGESAGDTTGCWHTAANRLMLLTLAGRWADRDDVLDRPLLRERPPEPDQAAIATLFGAVIDEATGRPVDLAALERVGAYAEQLPESTGTGFYLANRAMAARARGDVAALVDGALAAVATCARYCGIDDDFPHLWPLAAGWLLDAGRYAEVRTLLQPVLDTPATRWSPLLAAQVARVRGTLEALDPDSVAEPAQAERDLRTAITELTAFGARPAAARTQVVLADLLRAAGRPQDAETLLAEAQLCFADLGAQAWLLAGEPAALRAVE